MKKILTVENLKVRDLRDGEEIIHGVSFSLKENTCLGIVGETGSGKSMITKSILGLSKPWLKTEGFVSLEIGKEKKELLKAKEEELREIRGKHMAMILQDGMSAYDPLGKIGDQMAETLIENLKISKKESIALSKEGLRSVNIREPEEVIKKYPHQLSGGMLQRCMIATALILKPEIIIADEPTTALDSINQGQVIEEFKRIRKEIGTALIFISHDLGVVKHLSDELLVMRDGNALEYGDAAEIFKKPQKDYTKYLIESRLKMTRSFKKALNDGAYCG